LRNDAQDIIRNLHIGLRQPFDILPVNAEQPRSDLANFFQGAFGGSYLNYQYLISATVPRYPDAHL
jgi:hypothetical protein